MNPEQSYLFIHPHWVYISAHLSVVIRRFKLCRTKKVLSVCEKNISAFSCNSEILQHQQIIHLSFCLSIFFYLSMFLSVFLSVFVYLSIFIYLSFYRSIYLSVYLPVYLSISIILSSLFALLSWRELM